MHKKRVLVVDDEAGFTRMVRLHLEQTGGYDVREEHLPFRAVAVAREFQPDLILLDVVFPGADGGDVLAQIRADPVLRSIPVLFVTAVVCREDAPNGVLQKGMELFIPKPVSARHLIQCIETYRRPRPPTVDDSPTATAPVLDGVLLKPDPA